jgi:hypothetical protein
MKFERCTECGLVWDRSVRGGFCPHCVRFSWFYAIGGGLCLLAAGLAVVAWFYFYA